MILIITMENSDYLDIDGRQLRLLLTIQVAGSLSGAAKMLDMNQSTVSYWLDLLRRRTGDPLFVRSGNGVEPTERAKALFPAARAALRHLEGMFEADIYDPAKDLGTLRLTATAVERDLLVAPLFRHALSAAPGLTFEVLPSGSPFQIVDRLQLGAVDFAVVPDQGAEGEGIMRRTLLTLTDAVFFDPAYPLAAGDLDAFCARPQARVAFGPDAGFGLDRRLARLGKSRLVKLQVSDFDSVLRLIRGTPLIATLPRQLADGSANGLTFIDPPWAQDGLRLSLFWHARNQSSARHAYWRDQVSRVAKG